jgi:hypothetical protein
MDAAKPATSLRATEEAPMKAIRITRPRHAITLFVLAALGLFLGLAPTSYASTGPGHRAHAAAPMPRMPGLTPRIYALMRAQVPLDRAATQIQDAAAKPAKNADPKPVAGFSGFFETQVNDATRTLTVRWHGQVPADIMRLIKRLRGKVTIRIAHTRYSLATLNHAVSHALRIDSAVTGGYPLNDGSGVHIDVRTMNVRAVELAMRPRLGVPVIASPSGGVRLQATCTFAPGDTAGPGSRCYDLPPGFWGGDVIQSAYAGCTGGFGVHDASGNTYMLTAAHCAETSPGVYQNGVNFWNGNYTAYMGQITDVPGPYDWAEIPTSTANRYYDGPGIYAGDSYYTKQVVGQQGTSVGDWLCESGAFGGVKCSMRVTALNYSDGTWISMALASAGAGYSINGDSGGPWFSLAWSGAVTAAGIHHGITTDMFGHPTAEVFTPISLVNNLAGFWVNT